MARRPVEPGQVWFVDFDPARGREQGKDRPALVVSSRFHLSITMGQLVSVLPLTGVERAGWLHRVHVAAGGGWVVTEQIRTVSINRFRRHAAELSLSAAELRDVRRRLVQMLIA
jgi:mRNA interferase MazF